MEVTFNALVQPLTGKESLQQQYLQTTLNNADILAAYNQLWKFNDADFDTCKFEKFKMEGYLRKKVSQGKIFFREMFPKRYFVIDFTKGVVEILDKKYEDETKRE